MTKLFGVCFLIGLGVIIAVSMFFLYLFHRRRKIKDEYKRICKCLLKKNRTKDKIVDEADLVHTLGLPIGSHYSSANKNIAYFIKIDYCWVELIFKPHYLIVGSEKNEFREDSLTGYDLCGCILNKKTIILYQLNIETGEIIEEQEKTREKI